MEFVVVVPAVVFNYYCFASISSAISISICVAVTPPGTRML